MNLLPFKKKDLWIDPFESFGDFQNEISHYFKPMSKWMDKDSRLFDRELSPSIDVYDSGNEVLVKADVPGLKTDEIDVSIYNNVLTIKGEKKRENEVSDKNYIRSERFYGSFSRSVQLPSEVDQNNVSASYKNGVLELKIPKKEEAKTKHINIDIK